VIEHLLSKHKALSSNPSTAKKKKKKRLPKQTNKKPDWRYAWLLGECGEWGFAREALLGLFQGHHSSLGPLPSV
jgi:hypothetical protein